MLQLFNHINDKPIERSWWALALKTMDYDISKINFIKKFVNSKQRELLKRKEHEQSKEIKRIFFEKKRNSGLLVLPLQLLLGLY